MVKLFRHLVRLLCTGLVMAAACTAGAQSATSYPSKPVRIIVPTVPGGASDVIARLVSEKFFREMGQNFVVDNRGGGDGIIGTGAVARAAADGYTLLLTTDSFLFNHWLHTDLPYDSLKDFTLISPLTRAETVLTVHPSVAANNLRDFITYARANPGKLNAASGSLLGVVKNNWFMNLTGTKLTNVNYKGGGPAIVDLLAGNVQVVIFTASVVLQHINAGKLKALAISGDRRDSRLPDVPTFAEGALKEFDPAGPLQMPFLAPSRTPRNIMEKLNAQVRRVLADPEVIGWLSKQGLAPVIMTAAESEKLLPAEMARYGKLIKDAGVKPENK